MASLSVISLGEIPTEKVAGSAQNSSNRIGASPQDDRISIEMLYEYFLFCLTGY